jgi:phage terminase large subunit-like protein
MSALVLAFPNDRRGVDIRCRFWVPEHGKWRHEKENAQLYRAWERAGHLTFTGGEAQDFDQIEADILEENDRFPFRQVLADRAYASMLLSRLQNVHGMNVLAIPQGPITLNEPMLRLESMILSGAIRHDGHPVLTWNVGNANARKGPTGLLFLDKSSATKRVDGLAALLNALVGWMSATSPKRSVYEERGPRTL